MILSLSLYLPSPIFHARCGPKFSLQNSTMPAKMAFGDLFVYRYFQRLSCVPHLGVGRKNNMWLGYSFHHVYISGGKGTWLHCGQKHMQMPNPSTTALANSRRALRIAQEGHFSDAMRALGASGCASPENVGALNDLLSRHPQNPLPDIVDRD